MIATVRRLLIPLPFLVLAGCQTLHADLSDAEMEKRVRAHFEPGISVAATKKRLYAMWCVDVMDLQSGDIHAIVWPKRFLIFGGILDYYGTKSVYFRFAEDGGLHRVVYDPGEDAFSIVLDQEVTP